MEKRIINEWNKIKDAKIFDSIDEFTKLFKDNPEGSCFRKYTNYDWNKDNFFFGTYQQLLDFYKTSLEVPFYLDEMIGKKYGQLTIKTFKVKINNNKRVYYANCICDCGRECEKEYSKIIDGHVTTCGKHKSQNKSDLLSNCRDVVAKYWDYSKNSVLPENVSINSNQLYWWVDDTGSFQLKPSELKRRTAGTSFNEQCIYYYFSKIFKNVQNRRKIDVANKKYEVDVYLEDYRIAIEYDGVFWHKGKLSKDVEKTRELNKQGVIVIHIREEGLQFIEGNNSYNILYDLKSSFCDVVNELCKLIACLIPQLNNIEKDNDELIKLKNFYIDEDTFINDEQRIINQYRINYVEDNLTKTCLIKFWDYDKNIIIPQKVSLEDNISVYFKCSYGFSKSLNVKLLSKDNVLKCSSCTDCLKCSSFYCPLWTKCIENNSWKNYYEYASVFTQLCPLMKRFFYYKLFIEKKSDEFYYKKLLEKEYIKNNEYKNYIGVVLDEKGNDTSYDIESIYKRHRQELLNDQSLLAKTRIVFSSITLSTKNFSGLLELGDFLTNYNPVIRDINYDEFDIDEEHRQFVIDAINHHEIAPHNWEKYKTKVSYGLFEKMKNIVSHFCIGLNTKIFTLEELKTIIEKYNPKISCVNFFDFDNSTESRSLLVRAISRTLYFGGVFSDWPCKYMLKWKIEQLELIKNATKMQEVRLTGNNVFEYVDISWKQRKNPGRFGLKFKKKNRNSTVKIDSIEIDFKEKIKETYFQGSKIKPKTITPEFEYASQSEISLGGKHTPVFKDFPFQITNINGFVILY